MDTMNTVPPPTSTKPAPEVAAIGEEGVYEVEEIRASRQKRTRTEYLIKWQGWPEATNTWEAPSNIHPSLVREFQGKPEPPPRLLAPEQFKRGAGCARVRLSVAAQKRGGNPQTFSMIAGNVIVKYKEPTAQRAMPTLTLIFFVLTMDKAGHITWPTDYDPRSQAALRMQARALLRKMMDDPLNPADASWEPAMTGTGSSARAVKPPRKLVEAGCMWQA
jgi:hypothetical protein